MQQHKRSSSRFLITFLVSIIVIVVGPPRTGWALGVDSPRIQTPPVDKPDDHEGHDHEHNDYALAELARQRNEPPFVAPAMEAVAPMDLISEGRWDAPVTWPFVLASAASLPDGRIVAWGGNNPTSFSGGTSTYAAVWDPATGQFLSRNHTEHSMFCAIPNMLEDGRVFVNGGDGTRQRTSTFDYRTNTWTRLQDMSVGRWYNGAVALPNGKVFAMLGDPGGPYPELWTPNVGWSLLTGANLNSGVLNYTGYQSRLVTLFALGAQWPDLSFGADYADELAQPHRQWQYC